jgi:hypothetical protein
MIDTVALPIGADSARANLPWGIDNHYMNRYAVGLQRLYSSGRVSRLSKPLALSISALLLFFSIQTNWNFYTQMLNRIEQMEYSEFVDKDELESFTWIRENLSQSTTFVVLDERARMLAGTTGCRVFYKNAPLSVPTEEKRVLRKWANSLSSMDTKCPCELTEYGITRLFIEARFRERYLSGSLMNKVPCAKQIYATHGVSIWKLEPLNRRPNE